MSLERVRWLVETSTRQLTDALLEVPPESVGRALVELVCRIEAARQQLALCHVALKELEKPS